MKSDISIRELKLFLLTTEHGNFSEVARREDTTPSSVSRKIAAMEAQLETKLFYRHTRAISLTESGVLFEKYARDIVDQFEQATNLLEQQTAGPKGTVKISAPVAFGRLHIAPFLPELLQKYPLLNVELMQTDSFIDPTSEAVDLVFRIGVQQDSSLRMKQFSVQNYVMAASPAYLAKHGHPRSPQDLHHFNCLVFRTGKGLQRWFIGDTEKTMEPYDVKGSLHSNNSETLLQSAVGGLGIVLFPTWLIGDALSRGQLVPVLEDYSVSTTREKQQISALYPDTRSVSPKVRAVIDFFDDVFGTPCYWDNI